MNDFFLSWCGFFKHLSAFFFLFFRCGFFFLFFFAPFCLFFLYLFFFYFFFQQELTTDLEQGLKCKYEYYMDSNAKCKPKIGSSQKWIAHII